jgi:hypothetical protein
MRTRNRWPEAAGASTPKNEIDGYCCYWLSNLMDAGLITPGKIDDRPIEELAPDDLLGLFAGVLCFALILKLSHSRFTSVWSASISPDVG